jgi:hypothetical protein
MKNMKTDLQLPLSIKMFNSWQYWVAVVFLISWPILWISSWFSIAMKNDDSFEWLTMVIGVIFPSYYLIVVMTATVTIYDSKIDYKSFFNKASINWSDVKTFGGFYETRQFITMIPEPDLRTESVLDDNKILFVSTNSNFRPRKWHFVSDRFIPFPYHPEIYDFVSEKLIIKT